MTKTMQVVLFALITLLGLSGCSGMRVVDTDVTSFALWPSAPPASGASYRFERLPSQQAPVQGALSGREVSQDQLEALARNALQKVGLNNNPTAATLNVQVSASTRYAARYPYSSPFYGGSGVSLGASNAGSFIGFSFPIGLYESPLYLREVSFVMREARSNAVVYETRASHSGIWADGQAVLPAMLDAALQGFPVPPVGPRRINIEIPR